MSDLSNWIKSQSDRVEYIQSELNRIDDVLHDTRQLLSSDFDIEKCKECGHVIGRIEKPVDPSVNVAEVNRKLRDLENKWDDLDREIDNILADVEGRIEQVFDGTVFDVYGIEVNI